MTHIADEIHAAEIRAKGEAATQPEIDALRFYEREDPRPVVVVHPGAVPVSGPGPVDLGKPHIVAALQELVLLGNKAAVLLVEFQK